MFTITILCFSNKKVDDLNYDQLKNKNHKKSGFYLLKTGHFSLVFEWHSSSKPFNHRTAFKHLNTGNVLYSDPQCTKFYLLTINSFCC